MKYRVLEDYNCSCTGRLVKAGKVIDLDDSRVAELRENTKFYGGFDAWFVLADQTVESVVEKDVKED